MTNEINEKISFSLNQILNDQRFDYILTQINMKAVKSLEKSEIDKEIKSHIKNNYDDFTQKRLTINYTYDNYENKININNKQGRNTLRPNYITHLNLNLNNKNINENILNLGKKIYNIIYDPLEKDIEIKAQMNFKFFIYCIRWR